MLLAIWFIGFAAFFAYLMWIGVAQYQVHQKVRQLAATHPFTATGRATLATLALGLVAAFWFIVLPVAFYRDYQRKKRMRRMYDIMPNEIRQKLKEAGIERP